MSASPSEKAKTQRKNTSPFCSRRKRKSGVKRTGIVEAKGEALKTSDKGSWFDPEKQWPHEVGNLNSSTELASTFVSVSKRKLEESKKAFLGENNGADITDCSTECLSSGNCELQDHEDERAHVESAFVKPCGNYIINPDNLQEILDCSAVCKVCNHSLQIVEKAGSKQGLGAKWNFRRTNESFESLETFQPRPISPKSGKIYEINRATVLGFRAIGKGRSAAEKCLSFLGLAPVYTWDKHTKLIEEKVKYLTETDFNQAVSQLKHLKRTTGEVADCTDQELQETVIDIGASFDCSWSSRGWSARDGLVAVVSEDTGKVLDVVYLTRECQKCKEMEEKRATGELSRIDFLSWYISHEPNCLLKHEGSAQVTYRKHDACL